jgi:Family of unknown function (DUF6527)
MSAANVQFLTVEGDPCPSDRKPERFTFRCVGRNRDKCSPNYPDLTCANLLIAGATDIKRDPQGQNGGRPQWDWDGNKENPTFSPSINCEAHCGWHGYIRNGRCVSSAGIDEP